jgi:hypothetical protein
MRESIRHRGSSVRKPSMASTGKMDPQLVQFNEELSGAFTKYCQCEAVSMEKKTYGYPIDTCDVSQLDDMSGTFSAIQTWTEGCSDETLQVQTHLRGIDCLQLWISYWQVGFFTVQDILYVFDNTFTFSEYIPSWTRWQTCEIIAPEDHTQLLARFFWKSFLSLSHPAKITSIAPPARGCRIGGEHWLWTLDFSSAKSLNYACHAHDLGMEEVLDYSASLFLISR